MQQIGAFEAKNTLSNLLDKVERGAEIVITRRGHPVAKLVPTHEGFDRELAAKAVERIRSHAKTMKLGRFNWAEWKEYRDRGRS